MEVGVPSVFYQLIVRDANANPTALRPPCLRASLRAGAYLVITPSINVVTNFSLSQNPFSPQIYGRNKEESAGS